MKEKKSFWESEKDKEAKNLRKTILKTRFRLICTDSNRVLWLRERKKTSIYYKKNGKCCEGKCKSNMSQCASELFFFWFITTFKIIVLPNFNQFYIRLQINLINNFNSWTVSMKWIHEKRKAEKSIFHMYVLTVFIWVHQSRKHVWTWDYIDWNAS